MSCSTMPHDLINVPIPFPLDMPATLEGMSAEIFDLTCKHLDIEGISALRLTSRTICDKVWGYFGTRYFKSMRFMLDPYSLITLLDIPKHEQLKKNFRNLCDHIEQISPDMRLLQSKEVNNQTRLWTGDFGAIQMQEQDPMGEQLQDVYMLSKALMDLESLGTFRIGSYKCYRESYWRSNWGDNELGMKMGASNFCNDARDAFTNFCKDYQKLDVVFRAIKQISAEGPNLDLYIYPPFSNNGEPFSLSSSAWRNVSESCIRNISILWNLNNNQSLDGSWFRKLLINQPSASGLTIDTEDQWIGHMYSYQIIFPTLATAYWPNLARIEFLYTRVHDAHLLHFLANHVNTLETIRIHNSDLLGDDSHYSTWTDVFVIMREMPRLKVVDLSGLKQDCRGWEEDSDGTGIYPIPRDYTEFGVFTLYLENKEVAVGLDQAIDDAGIAPWDGGESTYVYFRYKANDPLRLHPRQFVVKPLKEVYEQIAEIPFVEEVGEIENALESLVL
ncbi:hypothetical protein AOQ84DRAFT_423614 [Glonium stellatum]|uniref:Uncharacterized protein n=1 Tax=Glonium stellatum TaxID=574774 RepID=A0A8E2FCY8_9PEZI|nr:hypothetical protein AOQ84DRAFT_423614 [Glonium stellatum]